MNRGTVVRRWLTLTLTAMALSVTVASGCNTEGGLTAEVPFDLGGDSQVTVNVTQGDNANASNPGPSTSAAPAGGREEAAEGGAAEGSDIEWIAPAEGEIVALGRVYRLRWRAPQLSSPQFELALQNADGSPFKSYGPRGKHLGNGEYQADWGVNRNLISPGMYRVSIRDTHSGISESVAIEIR